MLENVGNGFEIRSSEVDAMKHADDALRTEKEFIADAVNLHRDTWLALACAGLASKHICTLRSAHVAFDCLTSIAVLKRCLRHSIKCLLASIVEKRAIAALVLTHLSARC